MKTTTNNHAAIFSNTRKRPDHKDPDYTGSAQVDGQHYVLSAWDNAGRHGKYISLSFAPWTEPDTKAAPPAQTPGTVQT